MSYVIDDRIEAYAREHSTPEDPALAAIDAETRATMESPGMLSGHLVGGLLASLVSASGARRVLEIGTFTGYSALAMAAALPEDGRLLTCEVSDEHATIAQRNFDASSHGGRIELRRGPALETLASEPGPWDLAFIDADKTGYRDYYEAVVPALAPRGLILIDNVLWSGRVIEDPDDGESTRALRELNDHIRDDRRVVATILTVRDGLTLIRRAPA